MTNSHRQLNWAELILDKLVIATVVAFATVGGSIYADKVKAQNAAEAAEADIIVAKTGELWESLAKYQSTLEKISHIKLQKDISERIADAPLKDYGRKIKSAYLEEEASRKSLDQLTRSSHYYVGAIVARRVQMYADLLKSYYGQKDTLMFTHWPKDTDLSFSEKQLNATAENLARMQLEMTAVRDYATSRR